MNITQKAFLIILIGVFNIVNIHAQSTIILNKIPTNTPTGGSIYIAGTFNNWNPGDTNYRMHKYNNDTYTIQVPCSGSTFKYKYTLGSWATNETDTKGDFAADRKHSCSEGPITDTILGWHLSKSCVSSAQQNVHILTDSFYMPQLKRYRRVWVYLPLNYAQDIKRHYRVLYMHDGQNVFDSCTSFSGEWAIDESLNALQAQGDSGCIVVAIDNGGSYRLNEYAPYYNTKYKTGGEGVAYADFIAHRLKPHIDSLYRTYKDRYHTGIAGSSMGALISLYAALQYPQVFSRVGVFSPAFWFNAPDIYNFISAQGHIKGMKIYIVAGHKEGDEMITDIDTIKALLQKVGYNNTEYTSIIQSDGQHKEWFWRREFTGCYNWLWNNSSAPTQGVKK